MAAKIEIKVEEDDGRFYHYKFEDAELKWVTDHDLDRNPDGKFRILSTTDVLTIVHKEGGYVIETNDPKYLL